MRAYLPVEITVRYADGRSHSLIPVNHEIRDLVWDRKMVENPAVDHYCRQVPGPDVDLIISLRRTNS